MQSVYDCRRRAAQAVRDSCHDNDFALALATGPSEENPCSAACTARPPSVPASTPLRSLLAGSPSSTKTHNSLPGEWVEDWLTEARLTLETRQVSVCLSAYANAVGLGTTQAP
ncbi:hypothetical protein VZT92_022890 [Zoarces viviparus]|uniref:Uncharacterized protein n=1 Tax=Zoarces viviparus TaxID=48416 RepID=A0AAW1E5N0_ZOAVI